MSRPTAPSWLTRLAVAAPVLLFIGVYLPVAGRGFVQDDYVWVLRSRAHSLSDLWALFHQDNGFYRPLVSVTFAIDGWIFGTHPWGYGATNVLLALLCAGSIVRLARALSLSWGASVCAGALWLLNFQGIRMAVLWTSGRTALVVTLAATAAATALVGRRYVLSLALLGAAIFSKEEAVLLPAVFLAWLIVLQPASTRNWRAIFAWTAGAAAVEALYFLGRASTHAMTLGNAPAYYRLNFAPSSVLQNIVSYADRVATLPLAVTVLAAAVLGFVGRTFRSGRRGGPEGPPYEIRTIALAAAAWVVGMFGITIFVPVRSDLYACLPSVGTCVLAAAVCEQAWAGASPARQRVALVGVLVLMIVSVPVYVSRTGRYVQPAEFATSALAELTTLTTTLPEGSRVIITDERRQGANVEHRNLSDAFGTLIDVAFELTSGRHLAISIGPPADATSGRPGCPSCPTMRLAVVNGHVQMAELPR